MPQYCLVKHRIENVTIDGADPDRNPDRIPVTGTVTFEALLDKGDSVVATEGGVATTITLAPIEARITNGELWHRGEEGVKLFAGGPDTNPERIRYRAKFSNLIAGGKKIELKTILFEAVPGGELTLSMTQPVPGKPYPGYSATIEDGISQIEGARDEALGQVSGAVNNAIGTRLDGKSNVGHKHESVDITDATYSIAGSAPDTAGKLVKLGSNGKLYISTNSITESTEPANKKYVDDVEVRTTNALAGKAPTTHAHKSSQIDDATQYVGVPSLAQRLLRTNDAGKISVPTSSITEATDPANKAYVDDKTGPAATSSTISYTDPTHAGKIVRLNEYGKLHIPTSAITGPTEPANKKYVDDVEVRTTNALAGKANLTHVHKSAQIDDATHQITGAHTNLAGRLVKLNSSGRLEVSLNSVTGPTDVASKLYVDNIAGSGGREYVDTQIGALATGPVADATQAAQHATTSVEQIGARVTAVEAMSGISPESPADGQTASLVTQGGSLTRAAIVNLFQEDPPGSGLFQIPAVGA